MGKYAVILAIIASSFMLSMSAYTQNIPQVVTDKGVYNYGEAIKVNFSNAPGKDSDWICIVPVGSTEMEAGSYQYMAKGVNQGSLSFDTLPPGKYEARAFYDYRKKGYVISARYSFSIEGAELYEKALAKLGRKIDTQNPLESNLPPGNGMAYIVREPYVTSAEVEVQIIVNGTPIVIIENTNYFPFSVPAGNVKFSTGILTANDFHTGKNGEVWSVRTGEETIKVKPGNAYYIKLAVITMGGWGCFLTQIPYQEGVELMDKYKLTMSTRNENQ
jgi:hypothetical protein